MSYTYTYKASNLTHMQHSHSCYGPELSLVSDWVCSRRSQCPADRHTQQHPDHLALGQHFKYCMCVRVHVCAHACACMCACACVCVHRVEEEGEREDFILIGSSTLTILKSN